MKSIGAGPLIGCFKIITLKKNSKAGTVDLKNTPHGRWGQGPGSVDPRFPAGLPFPVPEILEFVAFCDSGNIFQQFCRSLPGSFLQNSCTDPRNSHSLLEFSDTRIKLSFPNYLGCYSYSFRARQELISVTVPVLWV